MNKPTAGVLDIKFSIDIHNELKVVYIQTNLKFTTNDDRLIIDENLDSIMNPVGEDLGACQILDMSREIESSVIYLLHPDVKYHIIEFAKTATSLHKKSIDSEKDFISVCIINQLTINEDGNAVM